MDDAEHRGFVLPRVGHRVEDALAGLAERMAAQLEAMLSCTDFRCSMVEVVFASQLRLFHKVDSAWCNQNLMPLLGWTDESRAIGAWEGSLWNARLNDPLLEAGLLEQMLTAVEHRSALRTAASGCSTHSLKWRSSLKSTPAHGFRASSGNQRLTTEWHGPK